MDLSLKCLKCSSSIRRAGPQCGWRTHPEICKPYYKAYTCRPRRGCPSPSTSGCAVPGGSQRPGRQPPAHHLPPPVCGPRLIPTGLGSTFSSDWRWTIPISLHTTWQLNQFTGQTIPLYPLINALPWQNSKLCLKIDQETNIDVPEHKRSTTSNARKANCWSSHLLKIVAPLRV